MNRSPDDWYANLELGIAASLTAQHDLAASSLQRARRLDPGEPIVRSVVRTFEAGRRIDSDAVDREFEASQAEGASTRKRSRWVVSCGFSHLAAGGVQDLDRGAATPWCIVGIVSLQVERAIFDICSNRHRPVGLRSERDENESNDCDDCGCAHGRVRLLGARCWEQLGEGGIRQEGLVGPGCSFGEDHQGSAEEGRQEVVVKHVAAKTATLPFTGLDLGFVAGAGVVLLGMGFSLRRVTRKQPTASSGRPLPKQAQFGHEPGNAGLVTVLDRDRAGPSSEPRAASPSAGTSSGR